MSDLSYMHNLHTKIDDYIILSLIYTIFSERVNEMVCNVHGRYLGLEFINIAFFLTTYILPHLNLINDTTTITNY